MHSVKSMSSLLRKQPVQSPRRETVPTQLPRTFTDLFLLTESDRWFLSNNIIIANIRYIVAFIVKLDSPLHYYFTVRTTTWKYSFFSVYENCHVPWLGMAVKVYAFHYVQEMFLVGPLPDLNYYRDFQGLWRESCQIGIKCLLWSQGRTALVTVSVLTCYTNLCSLT